MYKSKKIKAILFDLDGTLVDLPIDYGRLRKRLKKLFMDYGVRCEFEPLIPGIERCILKLKRKIPKKETEKIRKCAYDMIDEEELRSVKSCRLIPGLVSLLKFAKSRKIKIVIFTRNCSKCVNAVFKKYNLPKPDLIASRDKVKKLKPDKHHLSYVLDNLKISGDECIIIGDSHHDEETGKRFHVKTIIIRSSLI